VDLRERLRLLKAAGAARPRAAGSLPSPAPAEETAPRDTTDTAPRPFRLADGLEGHLVTTVAGEAFVVEHRYPLTYRHGPLPLAWPLDLPPTVWPLLGRVAPDFDLRRAAFLDTETTGLAGGTGTYAFLVGIGFFRGDELVIRQYFLRDYPEEEAMLTAVAADLAPVACLVTFNGKTYDWPLLETRYRMNRLRPPLGGAPHLDLLHPARRIWRQRLASCSLQDLERQILGETRVGDVAGSQIPALYFDYLRSGDAAPLAPVLLHNRLDILSLVSLAGWLGHMVADPLGATPDGELLCGDDLYQLGRLFEDRGLLREAVACYEGARQRGVEGVTETALLRRLSFAYKRAQERQQAVAIWEQMVEDGGLSLFPFIELAKYHEHVTRRYDVAEELTVRALAVVERRRALAGPGAAAEYREVLHRLERLRRKQGRPRS